MLARVMNKDTERGWPIPIRNLFTNFQDYAIRAVVYLSYAPPGPSSPCDARCCNSRFSVFIAMNAMTLE